MLNITSARRACLKPLLESQIGVHLVSNPSHLEAVDPVAMGRARAKQTRLGGDDAKSAVVPIVMHGDAAFAGQGIWAETLNLADLKAYTVGGTVHIIVNNLIGFTTRPVQTQSSRFASDIAKRQSVPIFHVKRGRSRCGRTCGENRRGISRQIWQ